MLNKKAISRIQAMLSNTDDPLLVRSLGEGQTMITGSTDNIVTNIILPVTTDREFMIHKDQLNKVKAFIRDIKPKEEFELEYIAEHFGSMVTDRRDTDSVMSDTVQSQLQADFHVDFKLLESVFKATKEKSTIIRVTKYDNDRLMISTQEGAVSCLGAYKES